MEKEKGGKISRGANEALPREEREKDLSIRDSSKINLIAKRGEFNNRVSSFVFKF